MRSLGLSAAALLVLTTTSLADPKVDEQVVAPVVPDAKYIVSPQGGHLATVARKGSRMMVTVDGVAGPKVDDVVTAVTAYIDPRPMQALSVQEQQQPENQPHAVAFSKDGSHYAYVARIGQDWILYEDNKEVLKIPVAGAVGAVSGIAGNEGNTDIRIQFAPDDGKHLYFAKSGFAGYELWRDGQKMPGYFGSGGGGTAGTIDPLISRDGEHFAYLANLGTHPDDKHTLIIDGKDAGYLADNLQMTTDGKHLIGIGRDNDGERLLVDGKPLFKAKGIFAIYVAPVTNRIAAVLRHQMPNGNTGQFLLIDGKPAEATLGEQVKEVIFSPDGKRYAAVCGRSGAEFIVIDGKKGQEYQSIDQTVSTLSTGPKFSADSSKIAYGANANGKKFIVINDDESDAYEANAAFLFSPDGKHVITNGMQGQKWVLRIDDKVIPMPAGNATLQPESFVYSPDVQHYGFLVGGSRESGAVYIDGKDTGLVGNFSFSPDSKHVAVVGGRPADAKRGLFVDGNLAYPTDQQIVYRAFSPDGQHLFWMSMEPVTTPNPPDNFEWVSFVDGKPVAHSDRGPASQALLIPHGFGQFDKTPPSWTVGSDGALTVLTPSPEGIKRIKATPGADTGLAMILETAKAAEAKAKQEADPKFQQEKRNREVAEYQKKIADAKAAKYAEWQKQQEELKRQQQEAQKAQHTKGK